MLLISSKKFLFILELFKFLYFSFFSAFSDLKWMLEDGIFWHDIIVNGSHNLAYVLSELEHQKCFGSRSSTKEIFWTYLENGKSTGRYFQFSFVFPNSVHKKGLGSRKNKIIIFEAFWSHFKNQYRFLFGLALLDYFTKFKKGSGTRSQISINSYNI